MTTISLSEGKITELKTGFENFGRLPSEDSNTLFVKASVLSIQQHLNTTLEDSDINAQYEMAIYNLGLFYFNNKDFQEKQKEPAVLLFIGNLLGFYFPESKFIDRDSDSSNSIED